jgi:preprotein translocase subunit SecE
VARNRKRAKERRARRPQPVGGAGARPDDGAPDPIEHASPDVELAEAQLALGRPDLADGSAGFDPDELEAAEEADAEASGLQGDSAAEAHAPAPTRAGSRLINFLQGSWRELQRVQWPDRRQVIQATGVVIGFVIVAGVFLGVSDFLAGHLMNYILYGHW